MPIVTDRYGEELYVNPQLVERILPAEMKEIDAGKAKKNPDGSYSVVAACVVFMQSGETLDLDGDLQSVTQLLKVP